MKFFELIKKIETLSQEEIDKLVVDGLVLENIEEFIFGNKEELEEKLFKNEKLKKLILKEINSFVIPLFKEITKNPDVEIYSSMKKTIETYFVRFFKDGLEMEITTDRGIDLVKTILEAKGNKEFNGKIWPPISCQAIWQECEDIISKLAESDIATLSTEDVKRYDEIFRYYFEGHKFMNINDIHVAESILKLNQRDDINVHELKAFEYFIKKYENIKRSPIFVRKKEYEIFSILLDYDTILKNKGIEKEDLYSPIKEMEQAIKDEKFGGEYSLSKKETAFVLKFLQNPNILDGEANEKLCELLRNPELELDMGDNEIDTLLKHKEIFEQIGEFFPNLQNRMLEMIESNIFNIFQKISEDKEDLTPKEKERYSLYINNYYDISLEENINALEVSDIILPSIYFVYPDMPFNIRNNAVSKETSEFFEKYEVKIMELMRKIKQVPDMTKDEFELYDQIIKECSYVINLETNDNIEIIRALAKKSEELHMNSTAIENQIEVYIRDNLYESHDYSSSDFIEVILNYYETQLKGNAIEISENSAVSHLIRAAQKGKIPQDIATIVLDKLEERKSKNEIKLSNEDSLEQYMAKVAEIRLQNGLMPRECCEFIIKQSILNNEEMEKYSGMVERALEDFTEYELKDSGLENYSVMILDQPYLEGGHHDGVCMPSIKHISLSRKSFLEHGMIELLDTSLHECTHARQEDKMEKGDLDRDTYKMMKEALLSEEDDGFYKTNYYRMYNEIDARKGGYIKRLKVLRKIGLTDKEITKLQANDVKKTIREYCKYYEEGKVKTKGEETKDINIIFLELLQQKPQLLWEHPELQIEFEKKGDNIQRKSLAKVLKTYEQLLGTCENKKEIEKISSICSEILLNGGDITQDKLQDELEQLMAFNSDNEIINAYKNKILKTKFPREMVMMSRMKSMYENHSQQERNVVQEVFKEVAQSREQQKQHDKMKIMEGK